MNAQRPARTHMYERDGDRTGYGTWQQPAQHLGQLRLIETTACPRCGAAAGQLCRRKNGEDRVQQHCERWNAKR